MPADILDCFPDHIEKECRRAYEEGAGRLTERAVQRDEARKARWTYERQSDLR